MTGKTNMIETVRLESFFPINGYITDSSNSLLYTMTYNEDLDQLRKYTQADSGTSLSI